MSEDYNEIRRPREIAAISGGGILRGIASLLGIVIILVGLVLAVQTFLEVRTAIKDPASFKERFAKLIAIINLPEDAPIVGVDFPLGPVLAVVIAGGAFFLMGWISLGIMVAGAKIISWTTGDREAVRKIIRETLGTRSRP